MNKIELRNKLIKKRSEIASHQLSQYNRQLVNIIQKSNLWHSAQSIAIYLAFNNEADISVMLNTDKEIYLPSIKDSDMQFQQYHPKMQLETLKYGLRQPVFNSDIMPRNIDLYLMPLVGFDLSGQRLGMGGGFYDRYFADNIPGIRAGIGYSFQQVDKLPSDPWDVKLHHIFTELKSIPL